jgi:dTDP-4-dehydrorhamnose reductase
MADNIKKLLIVGCNGMLAQKIVSLAPPEYSVEGVDLPDFDITNQAQVEMVVNAMCPDVIINCAAYTDVDGCETEQALADQVNGTAVGFLAEAAKNVDAVLVHISTDYVFDGDKRTPYKEEDTVNPQSAYGRSKLLGEREILSSGLDKFFILRTSWLYGPGGSNFVETIVRLAKERTELGIVADQVGSPTYTGDLADAVYALLKAASSPQHPAPSLYGTYHFSNSGECSWYDFAIEIVKLAKLNGEPLKVVNIKPISTEDYPLPAKRPAFSVFSKEKYLKATSLGLPAWEESLTNYFSER